MALRTKQKKDLSVDDKTHVDSKPQPHKMNDWRSKEGGRLLYELGFEPATSQS